MILARWAKHLGATVIGTVGSARKAELALGCGCAHVINYRQEDFPARVKELTGGDGCHVVYDGVGRDTLPGSLDCLRSFGYFVSFGAASRPIPPFDITDLLTRGEMLVAAGEAHLREAAAEGHPLEVFEEAHKNFETAFLLDTDPRHLCRAVETAELALQTATMNKETRILARDLARRHEASPR